MPNDPAPPSPAAPADWLARYQPWRRWVEPGFWIAATCLQAIINTVVVWMDIDRVGLDIARWKPLVWEWSSNLVLLALVPAVIALERWKPLALGSLRANLPWHVAGSMVFSLVHVAAMVTIRKAIYAAQGLTYNFGSPWVELPYEYLKDLRVYILFLLIVLSYRLLIRRLQGEAMLLDAPDEGPPVEPIERPARFLVKKLGKEYL
ncbi:MAG: LytTR family transcriptional regulator, partial [Betaproteobacteria bacterium]|nr:LytTR family transcriptional regulator [Betaproteobacteria bacterium]